MIIFCYNASMKSLLLLLLSLQLLFAATSEQVEEYLTVSSSEEELLLLESQFSSMQNSFSKNSEEEKSTYDMQLLSVRFKEYIQKHLSETEMDAVLENYKNVLYLQFVAASLNSAEDNETRAYLKALESDPDASERMEILEKISKHLNKKESMLIMFDGMMKPLLQNAQGIQKEDDKFMEAQKKAYIAAMQLRAKRETLFNLKDFTIEELEEILKVVKTPAMDHETKAVYGAIAYALKEFFISISSRYDVSKHDPSKYNKTQTDTKNTK